MAKDEIDQIWDDWRDAVNMTAKELSDWLQTSESTGVGGKSGDGESTGHESGRRIVEIRTPGTDPAAIGAVART